MKFTHSLILLLIMSYAAFSLPVHVDYIDTPRQDVLRLPDVQIHELGVGFPPDELIMASSSPTELIACPEDYLPNSTLNIALNIQNLSNRTWTDVWYVADMETFLTNDDGLVNQGLAFKIDYIGQNKPLIHESMAIDGIFEPGEVWTFIIQNYNNSLGLPAEALMSGPAVGNMSMADQMSSGSIIVPEPASLLLLTCGGILLSARRK